MKKVALITSITGRNGSLETITPFYPRSLYRVAKQCGFWITKNYREGYGVFALMEFCLAMRMKSEEGCL